MGLEFEGIVWVGTEVFKVGRLRVVGRIVFWGFGGGTCDRDRRRFGRELGIEFGGLGRVIVI